MKFRIRGLDAAPFRPLFGLGDAALAARGVRRVVADQAGAFPDRVELREAAVGEPLLLLNYVHQVAATPYRASHAIFVLEGAGASYDRVGEVPTPIRARMISLRAFDAGDEMVDADFVDGGGIEGLIGRFFDDPDVCYLHAHYAKRGCYAARVDR